MEEKMTDKEFIVMIRRALKEGASIDAIENEFERYREIRISEACAKVPNPLAVCKNVLRRARKISMHQHVFHAPFTDESGEVFVISDGRGIIISVPKKYVPPQIAEKAKVVPCIAKDVAGMFEKAVKTHPVDTVVIHRSEVESWLADVDVNQPYEPQGEMIKYAVVIFDGVALDARRLKLCFDYTGEEKLEFGYWEGKDYRPLKCVCTQSSVTYTKFMLSPITDKRTLAEICENRELHELPITLTCKTKVD